MGIINNIRIKREDNAKDLKDFNCGIKEMDYFIHFKLDNFLADHTNQLFIARNENDCIIGMFVLSEGYFFDEQENFIDAPAYGKPFAILDKMNGKTKLIKRYSTIEIEYLAINKEFREKGIGRKILQAIHEVSKQQNTHFITVDAYCTMNYNAVPFYEKCGFCLLENQDRTYDTVRMVYQIE